MRLSVPRLPLLIFLFIILGSVLLGFLVIYSIAATHSRGEYLRLENDFVRIDFPKNWFASSWSNKTSIGDAYNVFLASPTLISAIIFTIRDENATESFMREHNLTDAFSIATFETEKTYNWIKKEKNENASIIFRETGSIAVLGNQANYSKIIIKDGLLSDGEYYNMSLLIMSYVKDGKLVEIVFWGRKEDCEKTSGLFEAVLNSTEIKV